jgi:mono/diheme cytochrome c family protein
MIGPAVTRCDRVRSSAAVSCPWLLLAVLATGCHHSDHESTDRPVPADRVLDFTTLYTNNCAGCHGADGRLGPAPPLNDPIFLAIVPDEVVLSLVSEGRPGTPMPAFAKSRGGPLTDDQVKALAAGIKPRWGANRPSRTDLPPYSVSTAGDKDRGLKVFARACSSCHGENGEGSDGMAGAIHDPVFLALISDQCLRRYAITGRADLGMPDFAGKDGRDDDFRPLTSAEADDLVALLAQWRRAGPTRQASKAAAR